VYLLEPQAKALQFAAKNVKVTGTISGDTIRVATIENDKNGNRQEALAALVGEPQASA
jgi:hypothetical protein